MVKPILKEDAMNISEQPITYLSLEEGRKFRVLTDLMTFKLGGIATQEAFFLIFDKVEPQGGVAMHRQSGQATFIIFEGELEFTIQQNDKASTFTASRGAVVHLPAGVAHAYNNISASPTSMFVLFTPAGKTEQFFERFGVSVANEHTIPSPVIPGAETLRIMQQEYDVQLVPPITP
jgi:quercetin dioxygenase-like cupin family protein